MSGDDSQEISEEELARIVSGAVNASASSGVRRVSSSTGAPVTLSDAAESVRAENAALEIEIAKLERNNSEKKAAIAKAEGDSRREIERAQKLTGQISDDKRQEQIAQTTLERLVSEQREIEEIAETTKEKVSKSKATLAETERALDALRRDAAARRSRRDAEAAASLVLTRIDEFRVSKAEAELSSTCNNVRKLAELCQEAVAALDKSAAAQK